MDNRFELYLYDGKGGGDSFFFEHLEDLMLYAQEFIGDDEEKTSQFNAYDLTHGYKKDISHAVGLFVMENIETPLQKADRLCERIGGIIEDGVSPTTEELKEIYYTARDIRDFMESALIE